MEEESASAAASYPLSPAFPYHLARYLPLLLLVVGVSSACPPVACADTLARMLQTGQLIYGSDDEGGAPFIYLDRNPPHDRTGFEVDLLARVANELRVRAVFHWGLWENLLPLLKRGEVDIVVNGYELTESRTRDYLATRPYYVYQLQLMSRKGGRIRSLADLNLPRPGGGRWRVGVLGNSVADNYAQKLDARLVTVVRYDGATNAMTSVKNDQLDATLQDLPAALFYIKQPEFAGSLALAGPPEGSGYYVMYLRKEDQALCHELNLALGKLIDNGEMKKLCEKYGLWNDAQEILTGWNEASAGSPQRETSTWNFGILQAFSAPLFWASVTTIGLAFGSMPIAMLIGLAVALGRRYGPRPVARLFDVYVEIIRGTPLMLQLYLIFFVLPEVGVKLHPWASGILGLAINYSAYESEIYRAGLQAVPPGQMEAALALGMSKRMALRRVIVPQAIRIVIPPVTSDFIALFKDTSVCSVVTLVELTKQYSILSNSTGAVIEFGMATALIYLAMSLPLSWFSRWVERKMDPEHRA